MNVKLLRYVGAGVGLTGFMTLLTMGSNPISAVLCIGGLFCVLVSFDYKVR